MRTLLIGSEGYIGSELSPLLTNNINLDLCWFGQYNSQVSIKDFANLTVDEISKFDAIILLAGHSSVKMSVGDWASTFNNNVRNFNDLLLKIRKSGKKIKLIYASSSSVYGNTHGAVVDESFINKISNNEYDISKAMCEQIASLYPDIEWYGLRFGTVNGYSGNLRRELMINSMYYNAVSTGTITVNNIKIYRAILGIQDLCRAILRILERGESSLSGFYNLASFNSSVEDISNAVAAKTGAQISFACDSKNPYNFRISTDKFSRSFDFKFVDSIETIVQELQANINQGTTLGNRDYNKNYA